MIELGLKRIARLLAPTPLPWRAIHVAGTNGKGSICAYVSGMLDAYNASAFRKRTGQSSIRHGRFTSPHLVDRWDCVMLDQQTVPFSVFSEVEKKVLERNKRESIEASEFELLTATAFEIFAQQQIDIAVIETGMGGRLDATNVIGQADGLAEDVNVSSYTPPPLVTAFSSIGMDHQEYLGDTLEAIAKEKAGILKPGVPVAFDWMNPPHINDLLIRMAAEKHCPRVYWPRNDGTETNEYSIEDHIHHLGMPSLLTLPAHVLSNLSVAFQATSIALRGLKRLPQNSSDLQQPIEDLDRAMLKVATSTKFPGRQQQISLESVTGRKQPVLLDGAHNHESARALAASVDNLRLENESISNVTWVLAASSTKDVGSILSPLIKDNDAIFAVEFGPVDGMPWVKPCLASDISGSAKAVVSDPASLYVEAFGNDIQQALKSASHKARGGPLVIAGSLYLVGDVLRLLRQGSPES